MPPGFKSATQSGRFEHLLGIVELIVPRELRDIAGMDDEVGLDRQRLHLRDRFEEGCARIGIGRLVEADVAVAQLDEGERLHAPAVKRCRNRAVERDRAAYSSAEGEQRARSRPRHALQKVTAVFLLVVEHRSFLFGKAFDAFSTGPKACAE
jgi:hypothetical protein